MSAWKGVGGLTSAICGQMAIIYPIDTIKTRLQVRGSA
jgi:hypothetical protein